MSETGIRNIHHVISQKHGNEPPAKPKPLEISFVNNHDTDAIIGRSGDSATTITCIAVPTL